MSPPGVETNDSIHAQVVMDPETAEPTDKLMPAAIKFCKSVGCNVTTMSEILASKNENIMTAIQKGLDRANAKATSRAQKVGSFD